MKANAASVSYNLGGGADGNLAIIRTIPEYANVLVTSEHKELLRLIREANNVEACLLKQLGKVLPELYLKSFRNEYSNIFNTDLQTILLCTYSRLTATLLQKS